MALRDHRAAVRNRSLTVCQRCFRVLELLFHTRHLLQQTCQRLDGKEAICLDKPPGLGLDAADRFGRARDSRFVHAQFLEPLRKLDPFALQLMILQFQHCRHGLQPSQLFFRHVHPSIKSTGQPAEHVLRLA